MKTTKQMIEVMQAFVDGKEVEWCISGIGDWEIVRNPHWKWDNHDYRIVKEKETEKIPLTHDAMM